MGEPARTIAALIPDSIAARGADYMRTTIDEMVDETISAIRAGIPEYARPGDEGYRRCLRVGVDLALRHFLATLRGPGVDDADVRALYWAIGAGERREGRNIDALQAAIRIGARIGCRRLVSFAEREGLPVRAIGPLTDAVWAHVEALAEASAEGYAHEQADTSDELLRRRRRLLALLVTEPSPGHDVIAAAASAARWNLPRRLAAVALAPPEGPSVPPLLTPEVLLDLDRPDPMLIVPDPENARQVRLLANALRGRYRAAVGPSVPPSRAAASARWAGQTLRLMCRGVIPEGDLVRADDHLGLLVLFQDEELLATLARRRLSPLAKVKVHQRAALAETYLSWLQHNQNANAVAVALHLHPQTVRRRLRRLELLFGDLVQDPEVRFELELALRAIRGGGAVVSRGS